MAGTAAAAAVVVFVRIVSYRICRGKKYRGGKDAQPARP